MNLNPKGEDSDFRASPLENMHENSVGAGRPVARKLLWAERYHRFGRQSTPFRPPPPQLPVATDHRGGRSLAASSRSNQPSTVGHLNLTNHSVREPKSTSAKRKTASLLTNCRCRGTELRFSPRRRANGIGNCEDQGDGS